jgi:hypothetical protein
MDSYLRREKLSLATFFSADAKPVGGENAESVSKDVDPVDKVEVKIDKAEIERRIRDAYGRLARSRQDWVGLVALRPVLGAVAAADVDAVLRELSATGQIRLTPESNRKTLTDADHRAAIRIGGEDNHHLMLTEA